MCKEIIDGLQEQLQEQIEISRARQAALKAAKEENERLLVDTSAMQSQIEWLTTENERLRAALQIYADPSNWDEYTDGVREYADWNGDKSHPWLPAHVALGASGLD